MGKTPSTELTVRMDAGRIHAYNTDDGTHWTVYGWTKSGRQATIEIDACDVIFMQLGRAMKVLLDSRQAQLERLRKQSRGEDAR